MRVEGRHECLLNEIERRFGISNMPVGEAIDRITMAAHDLATRRLVPADRERGQLAVRAIGEQQAHVASAVNALTTERTSGVEGKSVSVRVGHGGRRLLKKKTNNDANQQRHHIS